MSLVRLQRTIRTTEFASGIELCNTAELINYNMYYHGTEFKPNKAFSSALEVLCGKQQAEMLCFSLLMRLTCL